jgi:hypothetical protein
VSPILFCLSTIASDASKYKTNGLCGGEKPNGVWGAVQCDPLRVSLFFDNGRFSTPFLVYRVRKMIFHPFICK